MVARFLVARVSTIVMLFALCPPVATTGQSTVHWRDFKSCQRCDLTAARTLALGESDGPGAVQSDAIRLVSMTGHGYILHAAGGQAFALFDEQGKFIRAIGRRGQGPGEFTAIMGVSFADEGRVIALDYSGKWSTFTETGALAEEVQLTGVLPGEFQLEGSAATAIVARMDRRPEAVGFPLHRVDLVSGKVIQRLGISDPLIWSVREPWGTEVLIGREERLDSTVWWGKVGSPHIEEWSVKGAPLRIFTGDLPWFVPIAPAGQPSGAPWNLVADFAVDGRDRLWLVTLVADPRWRGVRRGPEGSIPSEQAATYFDSRVDVFDLPTMRHLGFHIWDSHEASVLKRGGQVLVYVVEDDKPTLPRVVLYEVLIPQLEEGG